MVGHPGRYCTVGHLHRCPQCLSQLADVSGQQISLQNPAVGVSWFAADGCFETMAPGPLAGHHGMV